MVLTGGGKVMGSGSGFWGFVLVAGEERRMRGGAREPGSGSWELRRSCNLAWRGSGCGCRGGSPSLCRPRLGVLLPFFPPGTRFVPLPFTFPASTCRGALGGAVSLPFKNPLPLLRPWHSVPLQRAPLRSPPQCILLPILLLPPLPNFLCGLWAGCSVVTAERCWRASGGRRTVGTSL